MQQYEAIRDWVVQSKNRELANLIHFVGGYDNYDFDAHCINDGYYAGYTFNNVLAKIKADQIFGFGSASLDYIEKELRAGTMDNFRGVALFRSGLSNLFQEHTGYMDCGLLYRAFIKSILVREYNHAFDLVFNAMGNGCIVWDLSQEQKRAFIEFALANGIKFRDME